MREGSRSQRRAGFEQARGKKDCGQEATSRPAFVREQPGSRARVITIEIPTVLRPHAIGNAVVSLDRSCTTVRDALAGLAVEYPGVVDRVLTETGELREHVNVFIGAENVRFMDGLSTPTPDGSNLMILAAVSGG